MKCIRNICLYLKKYISDKQFERIFYQDIDDFKSILEENIYIGKFYLQILIKKKI